MVRQITKAEQARGALIGTPGSMHARHSSKPQKEYGPGFFGGRGWKWGFVLLTLLSVVAFVGFIVYEETQHAEETGEDPHTETPGVDEGPNSDGSGDTSGTALGPTPTSIAVLTA